MNLSKLLCLVFIKPPISIGFVSLILAGNYTHLTSDAIIYHKDNNSEYHGVGRYPPYIKINGTVVVNQPWPTEKNSQNQSFQGYKGVFLKQDIISF